MALLNEKFCTDTRTADAFLHLAKVWVYLSLQPIHCQSLLLVQSSLQVQSQQEIVVTSRAAQVEFHLHQIDSLLI